MRHNRKHINRLPEHLLILIYNFGISAVIWILIIIAIGIKIRSL